MRKLGIKNSGFTLIEILAYLAIFTVVSLASMNLMLSLNTLIERYQVETALYRSGTAIMEQIMVELRRADDFDAVNSVIESPSSGVLTVDEGATETRFTKTGTDIILSKNGVSYGALNSLGATVESFTVYRYTTAAGTLVRVHVELQATNNGYAKSVALYGGAIIRGSI